MRRLLYEYEINMRWQWDDYWMTMWWLWNDYGMTMGWLCTIEWLGYDDNDEKYADADDATFSGCCPNSSEYIFAPTDFLCFVSVLKHTFNWKSWLNIYIHTYIYNIYNIDINKDDYTFLYAYYVYYNIYLYLASCLLLTISHSH